MCQFIEASYAASTVASVRQHTGGAPSYRVFTRAGARKVRAGTGTVESIRSSTHAKGNLMNSIVYIVGAVVIVLAILGFLGLR